jgi:hypothetical protein
MSKTSKAPESRSPIPGNQNDRPEGNPLRDGAVLTLNGQRAKLLPGSQAPYAQVSHTFVNAHYYRGHSWCRPARHPAIGSRPQTLFSSRYWARIYAECRQIGLRLGCLHKSAENCAGERRLESKPCRMRIDDPYLW